MEVLASWSPSHPRIARAERVARRIWASRTLGRGAPVRVTEPALRFLGTGAIREGDQLLLATGNKVYTIFRMRMSCNWFAWALLAGILYLSIGVAFAPLSVPSVFFWRLAAWMVSAVVYAAHIGYEHFRIRSSPHSTALHVAYGAAIGAFGLAAAANVHSLVTGTGNLRLLRIALLVWPLVIGVPAYVVAFVLVVVIARIPLRRPAIPGR